jgi:hypothetical protein
MAEYMGFFRPEWGNTGNVGTAKRKFRWLFGIKNITLGNDTALPCIKAARPKLNFREMQAEHMNEVIHYPSKPEWQPIQLSLYDRCIPTQNPIFTWLRQQYDPTPAFCSNWYPCIDSLSFKPCCTLSLLDGCGNVLESWILEHCYPQNIDWGDLAMEDNGFVTVDFTLRYDRAFQVTPTHDHALYSTTTCVSCTDPPNCGEGDGGSGGSGSESENSESSFAMRRGMQNFINVAQMANMGTTGVQADYRNVNVTTPDFIMIF